MRGAKKPPAGQPPPEGWTNKAFIGTLAEVLLDKTLSGETDWRSLSSVLLDALEQRHLLLQLDDPDLAPVLARRGWNGALTSTTGDFLMLVDTNVGFNKTNLVVATSLNYDLDLRDPSAPVSRLFVQHANGAPAGVPCVQWGQPDPPDEASYPVNRCYWDYLRVYVPQSTRLMDSAAQDIPAAWTIAGERVPPRVDILDEGLPGLSSFGTLLVVPGGGLVETSMDFALPPGVVLTNNPDGSLTYSLYIRKQPGTAAVPLSVRIDLPPAATLEAWAAGAEVAGAVVRFETDLLVDRRLYVTFRLPENPK
jgi:hypothetical protein